MEIIYSNHLASLKFVSSLSDNNNSILKKRKQYFLKMWIILTKYSSLQCLLEVPIHSS